MMELIAIRYCEIDAPGRGQVDNIFRHSGVGAPAFPAI